MPWLERSEWKQDRLADLPVERTCNLCGETKNRELMIVQHRKEKGKASYYYFRPVCKDCHNGRERGHRREYKTKYLQRWRRENKQLNESYWKDNDAVREQARVNAARYLEKNGDAVAIQRRLRKRGTLLTIDEARELLAKYGRCYPTKFGLTKKGLRECERIRSRLRQRSGVRRVLSSFEIRIMLYEQSEDEPGLIILPEQQPVPYQKAAENLRRWWNGRREQKHMEAAA